MDLVKVVTNWLRNRNTDDPQREQFFTDLAEGSYGGVLFDIPCECCPSTFDGLLIVESANAKKYVRVSQRTIWSSKLKALDVRWQDFGDVCVILTY